MKEHPVTVGSIVQESVPSTSRVRSETGPAAVLRPRTPEGGRPVFRPRSPEARKPPPQQPLPPLPDVKMAHMDLVEPLQPSLLQPSSSSIGKKRRAPDDFEDHESVPVQYFSVDSIPVGGQANGRTPRSRRLQTTGFTPMRGGSSRAAEAHPTSPRRATTGPQLTAPLIADVTNSPRSKGNVLKKGWLKMKPGSSQASARATSSRAGTGNRTQNQISS